MVRKRDDRHRPVRDRDGRRARGRAWLQLGAAAVVLVVWAVIYLRAATDDNFNPPPEVSAVMLACAGWLWASGSLRR